MNLEKLKEFVERQKHKKDILTSQLVSKKKEIELSLQKQEDLMEARNIISEASRLTQEQFKHFVETLVTTAIQSVFPDKNYKFIVEFTLQGNKPQINLLVQEGNKDPYYPEEEQGGGLLDIVSFALRIVMWSLERPRSRNVLVFDEPFRWTGDLTELAANMMKEISHKMNLQVIMVTHDERLVDVADRSWRVERKKGNPSIVQLVGETKPELETIKIKKRKII